MTASFKPAPGFKKDYPVPNFGTDEDIITTQNNGKAAAKKLGVTFAQSHDEINIDNQTLLYQFMQQGESNMGVNVAQKDKKHVECTGDACYDTDNLPPA